jgi:hypothetical protein
MDKCCFFVAFSEQLKLHLQLETSQEEGGAFSIIRRKNSHPNWSWRGLHFTQQMG